MKQRNILLITLVISGLLIFSTFSGTAIDTNTSSYSNSFEVVKEVYDGENWVKEINAEYGDTVQFRITITYYNVTDPAHAHWAQNITVEDELPLCLEYDIGTAEPSEPVVDDKNLTWDLDGIKIYHGESLIITYNASVIDFGTNINHAEATANEFCTGVDLYDEDTATVIVKPPKPGIDVEKKVWDGICDWTEEIYAKYDEIVRFNITVTNTGDIELINVIVNDTLPDSLAYENNAEVNGVPYEPDISPDGKNLVWTFNVLGIGEVLYIEFDARVIGEPCSIDINWVDVSGESFCQQVVEDRDSATVKIEGMCMKKEVWDEDEDEWTEETTVPQGENVRFRITIEYYGDFKLYNIKVRDELPDCLDYANAATVNGAPKEPEIAGKKLWWNLTGDEYNLTDGEKNVIEFDAAATEFNCEDPAVNWAYVIADECSGQTLDESDDATVYVICGLKAEAGGPYSGKINEDINIGGSASGGSPPYDYAWDLEDDGVKNYDDATGEEVTWSWSDPGVYTIWLKVTDDESDEDEDYASVTITIGDNSPPNTPSISGPSSGLQINTKYYYDFNTTDPDGDQVWFYVDWGDGDTEDWVGPYDSGQEITLHHQWSSYATSYNIRVKAKDIHDAESDWESFTVKTPKTKNFNSPLFRILLKIFPIFEKILQIFEQIMGI